MSLRREILAAFRTFEHGTRHEHNRLTPRTLMWMQQGIIRLHHVLTARQQAALKTSFLVLT